MDLSMPTDNLQTLKKKEPIGECAGCAKKGTNVELPLFWCNQCQESFCDDCFQLQGHDSFD